MPRKINEEHQKAMAEAYQSGSSLKEIAALFGYSENTCLNALRRAAIARRSTNQLKKIAPQHVTAMVEAYQSGNSQEQIGSMFGYSKRVYKRILLEQGIHIRNHAEANRHLAIDQTFFDLIDTEAKAYWLGFITADGAIQISRNVSTLVIGLSTEDSQHLYKFKAALQSEHPVKFGKSKDHDITYIQIACKRLVEALGELGVGPNKGPTVQPCSKVPEHLLSAYWRGVFDGDGCISYSIRQSKTPYPVWNVHLTGNYNISAALFPQR